MSYRGKRFLIKKIDEHLGGLENELKFDRIMIVVSTALFVFLIIGAVIAVKSHPGTSLICGLGALFCIILAYTMYKEYKNDLLRNKDQ